MSSNLTWRERLSLWAENAYWWLIEHTLYALVDLVERGDIVRSFRAELSDEDWLWDWMEDDVEDIDYIEPSFRERQEHGDAEWTDEW